MKIRVHSYIYLILSLLGTQAYAGGFTAKKRGAKICLSDVSEMSQQSGRLDASAMPCRNKITSLVRGSGAGVKTYSGSRSLNERVQQLRASAHAYSEDGDNESGSIIPWLLGAGGLALVGTIGYKLYQAAQNTNNLCDAFTSLLPSKSRSESGEAEPKKESSSSSALIQTLTDCVLKHPEVERRVKRFDRLTKKAEKAYKQVEPFITPTEQADGSIATPLQVLHQEVREGVAALNSVKESKVGRLATWAFGGSSRASATTEGTAEDREVVQPQGTEKKKPRSRRQRQPKRSATTSNNGTSPQTGGSEVLEL